MYIKLYTFVSQSFGLFAIQYIQVLHGNTTHKKYDKKQVNFNYKEIEKNSISLVFESS